jgi:RNA polymerase sigma-70 factor (ECF subfamily)
MRNTGDYYLSGDIMQESFTRYLEKYRDGEENPALLYTIARNALVDTFRKRKRHSQLSDAEDNDGKDQEYHILIRDDYRRVLSALQKLDQDERDILALVVSSGLSYGEIASITAISEANVKVRVHRARVKLRRIMQEGEI